MKTILLALSLTCAGLWAQYPVAPPIQGATSNLDANKEDALREALHRVLAGKTNGDFQIAQNTATNVVAADPTLPSRVTPRPIPTPRSNTIVVPSGPPGAALVPTNPSPFPPIAEDPVQAE